MCLLLLPLQVYANVIVDTKGVDTEKYHADMYECEQISHQVNAEGTDSFAHDALGSTAKGAALGAAGGAISGGSGSKGAKIGAGIGLIGGALKHSAEKKQVEQNYSYQQQNVMHNCMVGRGYRVLN